jgi:flavodoxin
MKTIVVYKSLWGNTAAIARAMAGDMGAEGAGGYSCNYYQFLKYRIESS